MLATVTRRLSPIDSRTGQPALASRRAFTAEPYWKVGGGILPAQVPLARGLDAAVLERLDAFMCARVAQRNPTRSKRS